MFSVLLLLPLLSIAPQRASDDARMELSFSRVAARAGESAALPIYLISRENYHEPFSITLEFSAAALTFEKVETAYLAQRAKWTVTATVEDHAEKEKTRIVRIDIQPGQATFFPSGAVAYAHFRVAKDRADGDILLNAALTAPMNSTVVPSDEPAKITVFTTPVFGCFFYMH